MTKNKHVAVLLGGWNTESEVSRESGEASFQALKELGYKVTKIEFDRNISQTLLDLKPDLVFNALHGQFGEDGKVQGLLDILNIPYTHSGVLQSSLCMNKLVFRKICKAYNIEVPPFDILRKGQNQQNQEIIKKIQKPFVIKPVAEGSSVGIEVVLEDMEFKMEDYAWEFGDEIIIEKYIKGKELQVAVIDEKAVGSVEIRPKYNLFYDYESKYTSGMTDYIIPAQIEEKKNQELLDLGLKCHQMVGCKDLSRVDFLMDEKDGKLYLLEINTQPGFTPLSLVPKIAKNAGISFNEIVEFLVNNASCNK